MQPATDVVLDEIGEKQDQQNARVLMAAAVGVGRVDQSRSVLAALVATLGENGLQRWRSSARSGRAGRQPYARGCV